MVMDELRVLENRLRNIYIRTRDAINDETGEVNDKTIAEQAQDLKAWIADLERAYISESKKRPKKAEKVRREGAEIAEEAWHCYEVLLNAEIEAKGPPPTMVRWENLPSGVVFGEIKTQVLESLSELYKTYSHYRKITVMA
jgi:hypothetical protein